MKEFFTNLFEIEKEKAEKKGKEFPPKKEGGDKGDDKEQKKVDKFVKAKKKSELEDEELLSGKKERVIINPAINEGVAETKNQLIRSVGGSPKREKQWIKYNKGLVELYVFSESPTTHYIRMTAKNLSDAESKEALVSLAQKIRSWANTQNIPLIKAAPKVPDSVLGKMHIAMGSYVDSKKTMTIEISHPKGK